MAVPAVADGTEEVVMESGVVEVVVVVVVGGAVVGGAEIVKLKMFDVPPHRPEVAAVTLAVLALATIVLLIRAWSCVALT
jgi:hypothetical protein